MCPAAVALACGARSAGSEGRRGIRSIHLPRHLVLHTRRPGGSKLTCLNLHSCGIKTDGLLELAEGVRKGPMRKGILKLTGIDLSNVADQLPLPIREGVVWDNASILEDSWHQIEDREHGLSTGRPSTRGSRPPTRAGVDTDADTSTHEGDGDEEQDTKYDASELAVILYHKIYSVRTQYGNMDQRFFQKIIAHGKLGSHARSPHALSRPNRHHALKPW
jgi:hypothetical protein